MNANIEYLPEDSCAACYEGKLTKTVRDFISNEQDGRSVIIKDVQCTVCDNCDETFYSKEASARIEAALAKAKGE